MTRSEPRPVVRCGGEGGEGSGRAAFDRAAAALAAGLAMLLLLLGSAAHAGEVIAHPSVELDAEEIRELFLGEKQYAGGVRLRAVDNRAAQREFLAKVLQTDARTYTARWTKKALRDGLAAPDVKAGDAEVAAFVRATPGAVGYVNRPVPGVKLLYRF